jgi:NAD(P)-dependent dehydrogenase (short-subunit alcohol dehydrogenase family)
MSTIDASQLLRPGLLDGVSILLAGARVSTDGPGVDADGAFAPAARDACAGLGGLVSDCALFDAASATLDEGAIEEAVGHALAQTGGVDLLVVDGAGLFAAAAGERERGVDDVEDAGASAAARQALIACLDASWNVTRAVANRAFLPESRGGRIVYLAPPADAGEHADAARAGLENLARTLSIEWARHSITTVAIAPGAVTASGEVAALTAYLASPAGAYFSGCLLDLRGPAAR